MVKKRLAVLFLLTLLSSNVFAKDSFKVAWSHYTGWEPWGYADESGILKKWADKYKIKIKLSLINDYIESINLYTSGQFDACTMTNMDALTIPAVGGIDTEVVIIGDFSNGNDGIVMKKGNSVNDLKGRDIKLVELSVSHYLLSRALKMNGMSEKDVKVVNTSDAEIASLFISDSKAAVVTWNPPLQTVRNAKGANMVFDSSNIPGEIIDVMAVKTNADERLKKALTGAWYEVMAIMAGRGSKSTAATKMMAKQAGATVAELKSQIRTTAMFYQASKAVSFTASADIQKTMEFVRTFSFDNGLYGNNAKSKDLVGMQFPGNKIIGDKGNIKLRFTDKYMKMAADGKL